MENVNWIVQDSDKWNELYEERACELCGSKDEELLFIKDGIITKYPFRIVRCRSCGFLYANPRVKDMASLADFYEDTYYDQYNKHRDRQVVRSISELKPPPAKILDFGCGVSYVMDYAIKMGYQAEGFEVSEFSCQHQLKNGIKTYNRLESIPKNNYDVVIAIEVLEHLIFPVNTVQVIYDCLKPGGVFYYTTANFDRFSEKRKFSFVNRDLYDYIAPEEHLNYYTTKSIKNLFQKVGFSNIFDFHPKTPTSLQLSGYFSKVGLYNIETGVIKPFARPIYGALQNGLTLLGIRKKPLPIAIK